MSIHGGGARRAVATLLASLSFVGLSTASASAVAEPATITAVLPGPLSGCDPVGSMVSPASAQILSLVLPRATASAPSGAIASADSVFEHAEVTNLSPLSVDYQIRKGATWSDGTRVGLEDFVATARRGAKGSSSAAPQYRSIKSITAGANRHHVDVVFRRPTSAWQSLFSPLMAASTPVDALKTCSSPSAVADLSAGPYVIATSSAKQVVLVRNPHWRGRTPTAGWITIRGSLRQGSGINADTQGPVIVERSWMTSNTLASLSSDASLSSHVDLSNRLLSVNFRTVGGLTSSVMVRQAIAHFINRQDLVAQGPQALDPKVAVAGSNLLSQGQPGYTGPPARPLSSVTTTSSTTTTIPGAKPTGAALARSYLRRAGWHRSGRTWVDHHGRRLTLRIVAPNDDLWAVEAAREVAAQLAEAHVSSSFIGVPNSAAAAQDLRLGRSDLGIFARPTDPFIAHSAAWFSVPGSGPASPLWAGYRDKTVDALVSKATSIMNPVNAVPVYQQMGRRLWVMMPTLPLYTEPFVTAWTSQISGVMDNPYDPGMLAGATSWAVTSEP